MKLRCETFKPDFELNANFARAHVDSDSPPLEEVDVVELVELQRYLDGRLQLAARHFAVAVGCRRGEDTNGEPVSRRSKLAPSPPSWRGNRSHQRLHFLPSLPPSPIPTSNSRRNVGCKL